MNDPSIRPVLEARARSLARRPETEDTSDTVSVIVVTVGGERYAVDARFVQEVGVVDTLTAVPGLPPVWAGLVNVRGRVFPVLDLRAYLSLPARDDPTRALGLVFVSCGGAATALLSDTSPELRRIRTGSLSAPIGAASSAGAVRGVTSDFISMLNVETVLNDASAGARSIGG